MSYAMYPKVTSDFLEFQSRFGKVSVFDTKAFLVGPKIGEEIEVELAPVGGATAKFAHPNRTP